MRKTMAIVLRTADFKDSDSMLTLLTQDHGLMSAKVRGAKKQTSKLFCASRQFCCAEYSFFEKDGRFGVKGFHIKQSFGHMQDDYEAYAAACFVSEVVQKVAQEESESRKLFALVVNVLYALDMNSVSPKIAACYFAQRLLQIEGVYPQTEECVLCGSTEDLEKFSVDNGGTVCKKCPEGTSIDARLLAALRVMKPVLPKDIDEISMPKGIEAKLLSALMLYLEQTLQISLKTKRFLLAE
jgi:DNA repair protein RecO (recombination protein O)